MNASNNIFVNIPNKSGFIYKAYIGKGNNGNLIRNIIKSRWWWSISEIIDSE